MIKQRFILAAGLLSCSVTQATSFIDPDYTTILDSEQCNFLYPFAFSTGNSGLEIVDWDLQNFSDNY